MDVGVFALAEAAVIPYSTHRLLFLKSTAGEEFTVPAYLPDTARRAVYGSKSCADLLPTAYSKQPAAHVVTFLRGCTLPVHGLDRMNTRGTHINLINRAGLEEVIPRRKRLLLGWRWPTDEEYIFKLPAVPSPAAVDSTSSLSVLAAAATTVADTDTNAVDSTAQIPTAVDHVTGMPGPGAILHQSATTANTVVPSAPSPAQAVPTQCPPEAVISARLIHPVQYSSPLTMTARATYSADFNAVLDATMQHAMSLPGLSALWSMHPHQHSPFPSCTFGSFVTFDRESSTRLERGAALYSV